MIRFRCWYCQKQYAVADDRAGRELICSCRERMRVPRRSGGSSRDRKPVDRLVEAVVYGGGGALLGFLFGILVVGRMAFVRGTVRAVYVIIGLTLTGFFAGTFGGESFINWIGGLIRRREDD
jgi:hypothetical protein